MGRAPACYAKAPEKKEKRKKGYIYIYRPNVSNIALLSTFRQVYSVAPADRKGKFISL